MVKVADPKVTVLAYTKANYAGIKESGMQPTHESYAEDLLEFAGRACYQSFHRPNPATEATDDYIRHIIRQGHESVLEHASVTFYLEGVSRALTHELIRHRHLSYSQLSQRFVDESEAGIVVPPAFWAEPEALVEVADYLTRCYTDAVDHLQNGKKLPRKQAREAARAVLPNMTETKIVVTGNLRAWRDYLKKRLDPAADAEIRLVSQMILDELMEIAPSVFEDLDD